MFCTEVLQVVYFNVLLKYCVMFILYIPLISVGRLIARWPETERVRVVYVWL